MGEWSLVIFSVCLQAAVGLFIWSVITKTRKPDFILKTPALWATILTAVAMLASLGHLGVPFKAVNSISRIGSSWLSREILLAASFFVVALATYILERTNPTMTKGLYWLGSLLGIAGVFTMSKIYMNTVIPAWNSWYTSVDFFATALVLGGVLFLVLAKVGQVEVPRLALGILVFAMIYAALTPVYLASLSAGGGAAAASASLMAGSMIFLLLVKWFFILGGVCLAVLPRQAEGEGQGYLTFSLAVLAVGVLVGRYLFYAAGVAKTIGLV